MSHTLDIISVAGARPNFMKIAPLAQVFAEEPRIRHRIVHTGQHYDASMSASFFSELNIPEPWRNLGVGSLGHAAQTAEILTRFDALLAEAPSQVVLVVGDVNSTIACALAAAKRGIPVAHVEAGLRSFDRSMPEEINRVLTDAISDVLYVSEPSGCTNLAREGVDPARVVLSGNVMIDTLLAQLPAARAAGTLKRQQLQRGGYGLVTLHRPSNVDDPATLRMLLGVLERLARRLPLLFPLHPRTAARLQSLGLGTAPHGVRFLEPQGYHDFLALMEASALILTDSGGIQEEACILRVPCLTLRENTERPITVEVGGNRLVGRDPALIESAAIEVLEGRAPPARIPDLWDGRAAQRICADLLLRYGGKP